MTIARRLGLTKCPLSVVRAPSRKTPFRIQTPISHQMSKARWAPGQRPRRSRTSGRSRNASLPHFQQSSRSKETVVSKRDRDVAGIGAAGMDLLLLKTDRRTTCLPREVASCSAIVSSSVPSWRALLARGWNAVPIVPGGRLRGPRAHVPSAHPALPAGLLARAAALNLFLSDGSFPCPCRLAKACWHYNLQLTLLMSNSESN